MARPTDTMRGYVTLPSGVRVYGETLQGKRHMLPTGQPLPCEGPRDGSAWTVRLDGVGCVYVEPRKVSRRYVEITMRRGSYRAWNRENRNGIPRSFFHDGGTNPIAANVLAYLQAFGD